MGKAIDTLGYTGGLVIAVSLIPQIFKTHKTLSAEDISYAWQAVYITGLSLLLVYAGTEKVWPVFWPALTETVLIVYLTVFKMILDCRAGPTKGGTESDPTVKNEEAGPSPSTAPVCSCQCKQLGADNRV
ncbi:unnamed protein product [Heterosigma akashiwo]